MQRSSFTVVYDACVLYPAPLRDLLMWLALTDLFRAKWTDQIHEEWISNVLENRPDLTRKQLERTKQLMNQNVRDCLVTGYEPLIEDLELLDLDDRLSRTCGDKKKLSRRVHMPYAPTEKEFAPL